MKSLIKSALLMLALLLPATATAHDFEVDGIYYIINGNEATVTFRGTSYYEYSNEYSGSVTIPSSVTYNGTIYSVTSIGVLAFYNCSGLTSVTIPNPVTEIGYSAFSGCRGLTSVTIPTSLKTIGERAFKDCQSLTSVAIPNSVTTIGDLAFYNCSALTSVSIGNSVTSIGDLAFWNCSGLTSIVVASGNTTYDSRGNCNAIIETASNTLIAGCCNTVIPGTVTAIGDDAFAYCSGLTRVTIPISVTTIGHNAFRYCKGLSSVTIPNSVTSIGDMAFLECSGLKSVTIHGSVTSIGDWAFRGCSGLTDVYSHITDPSRLPYATSLFHLDDLNYSGRTLHVPQGTALAYQRNENWYPYFGVIKDDVIPTFTGVGQYPVIELIPEESTGLDKIFVVYNTDEVKMNYTASTDDAVKWERFDYSSGQFIIEGLTDTTHTGNVTTLNHVIPNTGYRITEGSQINYYWVVNYADHYMELNDVSINDGAPCNLLTINVDGHADAIYYYTVNGNRQVLDRDIKLRYYTQVWNGNYGYWWEEATVESFASLDEGIEIVPPLCGTTFVLTGDRFLKAWGQEQALESWYYYFQAVDCRSIVTPKYNVEIMDGVFSGTAPLELSFTGRYTDAVGYRVWEMATDPDFENIILQFNEDEIDYTFNEAGIYYVRYRVANETGTCEACGETYCIQVNSMACRPDVNRDGEVNIADVNFVINVILGDYDLPEADVNDDREVNIADINAIIDVILNQ
ncbi:MAG: leucine-rich repeat protein [Muribaculaceae bacterium]|nr:leucine-rich repeat protein [Muribaculaceae bacterium]